MQIARSNKIPITIYRYFVLDLLELSDIYIHITKTTLSTMAFFIPVMITALTSAAGGYWVKWYHTDDTPPPSSPPPPSLPCEPNGVIDTKELNDLLRDVLDDMQSSTKFIHNMKLKLQHHKRRENFLIISCMMLVISHIFNM